MNKTRFFNCKMHEIDRSVRDCKFNLKRLKVSRLFSFAFCLPKSIDMAKRKTFTAFQLVKALGVVVQDIANGAGGREFDSSPGQIGTVSPTAPHCCDVSS